ncbi:unnamed protein product, partial [Mesorhabditis belari]|uniref:Uncharacterized protein n=1 Tax=Mesorhabditis belari TaxID=2138241 RepID=A0AAF3EMI1_9BILA
MIIAGSQQLLQHQQAFRIYNEEVEKYTKAQNEDQELKKRLGNILKKASGQVPLPVDNKEVKKKMLLLKKLRSIVEPLSGKEEEDYRSRRRYSPDRSPRDRYRYHCKKREYENDRCRKGDDDTDIWRFNPKHRNDGRKGETSREYRHKEQSRSRSCSEERKKYL